MFQKGVKAEVKVVARARSHTSCMYQARSDSGGGIKGDPVQIIPVCFMCKHCNPIQNALKLLKGTISVTRRIIFFDAKQCHWTSFQASCM